DLRAVRVWYRHAKDKRDDTLMLAIIREFERDGITFDSALRYCPDLLANKGCLTSREPSSCQRSDIALGWKLAKEMGGLDVGQSVAVSGRSPLAVEAIEGTDECIRRAGSLCKASDFTVVKVAKPQQDMRFDVPTIGLGTLATLAAAGGRVLAIEAGRTIIIDQADVIEFANRKKLVVVALDAAGQSALSTGKLAG
ncbi:MAG: UDP-2,3-diacylglucosamine diphosphatase LpxI, partial [Planctomycetes bacterium]|nr:UDP-2,3-diacylglucosamine diphosphatase LpxI [Planctomycetota bacterium]